MSTRVYSLKSYFAVKVVLLAALLCLGVRESHAAADVTVTKTATPSPVLAGGTIHYTISAQNTASPTKALTGVTVGDNLDTQLTLVPGTVHASPLGFDDAYTVIGNTRLFVGQDAPAGEPNVTIGGAGVLTSALLANDVAITDSISLTTVAGAATTQGGLITIFADGSFIFTPKANFTGTDTYVYTIKNSADNTLTDTATVTFTVGSMVQYVNSAAGVNGDGRSNTPFNIMSSAQTASAAGDFIYMFASATNYGGITLKNTQQLIGNQVALVVSAKTLKAASGSNIPNIVNGSGNGVTLANTNTLSGFTLGNCSGPAISGSSYGTLTVSSVSINSTGQALSLSTGVLAVTLGGTTSTGGVNNVFVTASSGSLVLGSGTMSGASSTAFAVTSGTATVTYDGSLANSAGNSMTINNNTGGVVTFNGTVNDTGSGIVLTNNTGATIAFTNQITASTGANAAFTATGGGTVSSINVNSTLTTTTGIALNVSNTTIAAGGLKFKSISAGTAASGPVSGVILNTTGASGALIVTGDGTNNASGGTIQKTSGAGILLTSTQNVSLTSMSIKNTTQSGIQGTTVTNFTFNQGTIDTCGAGAGAGSTFSNIAFNANPTTANNIQGTLTITNCILNNAFFSGIDIQAAAGTISNATITGNSITSTTSTTTSTGHGINIIGVGTGSSNLSVTKATISNNVIKNFPLGTGIQISSSNNTGAAGPTFGIPNDASNIISVTGNTIQGQSAANPMNSQAINFNITNNNSGSRARANFDISSNGTIAQPVSNVFGSVFAIGINGFTDITGTINSNVIVANHIASQNAFGITVASGQTSGGTNAENPTLSVTCNNNNVSQQDGVGILMVARSASANSKFKIQNNTVAKPISGAGGSSFAIRVDSGNATSNVAETVCLNISGNTTGGGSNGGTGIGLRRSGGTAPSTVFGVNGMAATATPGIETYVNGLNPAGNTCSLISGSTAPTNGYSNCSLPLFFKAGVAANADCGCTGAQAAVRPSTMAPILSEPVENFDLHVVPMPVATQKIERTEVVGPQMPIGFVTRELTSAQLQPIVAAAQERWTRTGLTNAQIQVLKSIVFEVKPMAGWYLGSSEWNNVTVSRSAAGQGWFVDYSPLSDGSFGKSVSATHFGAGSGEMPAGHLDLLTAVMHEMGHQLGLKDAYKEGAHDSVMFGYLTPGERRVPAQNEALGVLPHMASHTPQYLFSPINIGTLPIGKTVTVKFDCTVTSTPVSPYQVQNTSQVSGTNITGSPISSNTTTTPINVKPMAFSASTPPLKGDVGFAYPGYTFIADGNPAPTYALSPTSGILPNGLSIAPATGVLSGTPTTPGSFSNIIVRATNNIPDVATGFLDATPFTMTIAPALTIAPAALAAATAGTPTNQNITISNGTTPYTVLNVTAFSAGTTGLTAAALTANAGAGTVVLSGTPTAAGTCTFTVNVTDTVGATLTKNYTLTVNAALTIAPAALAGATAGTATNQIITVSNGTTPYTTLNVTAFSAGTTGLTAANLTANAGAGTVTLNGTPTAAGTATFTVNVTDTAGATATKNYTLTVNAALSIAPAALAQAQSGQSTNQIITVSNGTTPYTTLNVTAFVAGGTGLTAANLTANAGAGTVTLSGTPTAAGTCTFTVNVTDTAGSTLSKNYSLTVVSINITPASLPAGTAGAAYAQVLSVNGAGLPLNSLTVTSLVPGATGLVAGSFTPNLATGKLNLSFTPAAAGTATFTVNVTDSTNATSSQNFSLTINAAISIAPAALVGADVGFATNQTITVSNGTTPYTTLNVTAFSAGTTGLTAAALTANAGAGTVALSGTPTAAGTCTFTVNVTDTAGATATKNYTLTVSAAMSIAPAALAGATAGTATNQNITVSGGTTPYTTVNVTAFSAGTTGLTAAALTTNTGAGTVVLSGTPTAAGTCTFTVNATDTASVTLSKNYTLTVSAAISITPAALAAATAGKSTTQTITVSGGTTPYTTVNVSAFSAGTTGLTAANLTPNTAGGTVVLSGTPTAAGTCTFTVNVTDTAGATATKNYTLTVNAAITIAPAALASATAGTATNQIITVSNGTTPYTTVNVTAFSAGTTGLTAAALTANAGAGTVTLSGTPTAAGTATFTVNVTDTAGATATKNFSLTVNAALSIAPAALAGATSGTPTNQIISVSNGTTPYTTLNVTAFSAGTTGLTAAALTANAGAGTVTLSGTPSAAGTCTFTVNVTDTAGATLSKNYTLTVSAGLSIAPAALAAADAGFATNQTITVSGGTTPYTTVNVSAFSAGTTGLTAANLTANTGAGTVVLSGTPTAAGTCTFTVNATDSAAASTSKNYTLTVNAALSIAPAALTTAVVGVNTNQTMTVSNGTTPYTTLNVTAFAAGGTGLTAANLTANAGAGTVVLNGTPTAVGTTTFTVNVTDTAGASLSKNYSLTVVSITVTPASPLPAGTATSLYAQTLTANNAALPLNAFTVSALVPGATGLVVGNFTPNLAAGTLALSFTPTAAGTATWTVNVTDKNNASVSFNYSLTINAALSIAPAALAQATATKSTTQTITISGGTTPYTTLNVTAFSAGTTGLTAAALTPNAGAGTVVLSGTPTAGTCTFTVNVTDTASATSSKNYTLTVNPALSIAPAALAAATATAATNQLITVSNGTTPYTTLNVTAFSAGTTGLTAAALTANAGAGTVTLSGTPTAAGTCTFTVNVTDTAGATLSKNYSLTVNAALSIAPAALASATATAATNQLITISNGTTPYTAVNVTAFSAGTTGLTAAALTANAGAGTVTLSGTPTAAGTCTFTVNVTDTAGATLSKNYSLTVNAALSIAPASLAAATATKSTTQTITVSNGTTPYTILNVTAFSAGTTGLTAAALTANAGAGTVVLSGTPTAAGTCTFTVNVTDTAGATLSKNYSLTVNPALSIAPASLAAATATAATNQTITVSNGTTPYTTLNVTAFSAGTTGLTAAALTANAGAGTVVLSGTPTAAGTCTFTVNVTDTAGATLSKNYSLTVNAALSFAPAALAQATAGTATNQTITVSNGTTPYTTLNISAFSAGTTGLTAAALTPNVGAGTVALSGTPTAAGTCTFTVNVTDTAGATASKNYTLTVNAALSIAPAALTQVTAGTAFSQTVTVSNGTTPYTTLTLNPFNPGTTGLTAANVAINPGAGTVTLSGTATAAGTATGTVNVTDTAGATLSQSYTLTVNPAVALSNPLPGGTVYVAYSQTIVASGGTGTVTFSLASGALPAGLALDGTSGVVSGTPTIDGTFNFSIKGTDSIGASTTQGYSVVIAVPTIVVAPATLPAGVSGVAYSQQLTASGGLAPYTFTLTSGPLPTGITLSASGLLSGTPTQSGTFSLTVKATDSTPAPSGPPPDLRPGFFLPLGSGPYSGSSTLSLTIGAPTIVVNASNLPNGKTGFVYPGATITATGGVAPYTFAVTAGALPPGLTMSSAGVISGTPTMEVNATFTVTATDSTTGTGPFTGSAVGTISIDRKPIFTSGPSFDANATVANLVGIFSATTDPTTAIITWDFGDGSPKATGAPVNHTYTTPGTYTITVTATNPNSGTSTTVTLTITVSDSNHLPDTTHTIRTQGTLTFGRSNDTLVLQAILPLPTPFPTSGAVLQFGLNGIHRTFTFDAHGKAGTNGNSAILREYKFPGNGIPAAKVSIKLTGALKTDATKGVSVNANGLPLKLLATFTLNGQTYSDIPAVQFTNTRQGAQAARFGFKLPYDLPPTPTTQPNQQQ